MSEKHYLPFDFHMKKMGSGAVQIEGYANMATVDRMKERIDTAPGTWELENFAKNPVMLFDHGKDPQFGALPVGRFPTVKPDEKGLYVVGSISNSKSEKISAVRDLVEEGILKTFSVGFAPKDSKSDSSGDVNVVTKAELIEISIVPIPMNQDSTFTLLSKKYKHAVNETERVWLQGAIERAKLSKKGAWVAIAVGQQISNLTKHGTVTSRDAHLKTVSELAGVSLGDVKSILSGDITPVPTQVIDAFATVLKLDKGLLSDLNGGTKHEEGTSMAKKPATVKKEVTAKLTTKTAPVDVAPAKEEEVKPVVDEPKPEAKASTAKVGVQAVVIPKESCAGPDEAQHMAMEAGYKADQMEEDDTSYIFVQPGEFDNEAEGSMMDLGDGCMAKLMPLKSAPKSAEAEEAKAAEAPADDKPAPEGDVGMDKEAMAKLAEDFKKDSEAEVPSWVTDKDLWDKASKVSEAAVGKVDPEFMKWYYITNGGSKHITTTDENQKALDPNAATDSPAAEAPGAEGNAASKQIELLSQILEALKKLAPSKGVEAPAADETGEIVDDGAKSFDLLKRFNAEVDTSLKSLGC